MRKNVSSDRLTSDPFVLLKCKNKTDTPSALVPFNRNRRYEDHCGRVKSIRQTHGQYPSLSEWRDIRRENSFVRKKLQSKCFKPALR